MKKQSLFYLFISYYVVKCKDAVFYPLKDMPEPDFNNQYDATML